MNVASETSRWIRTWVSIWRLQGRPEQTGEIIYVTWLMAALGGAGDVAEERNVWEKLSNRNRNVPDWLNDVYYILWLDILSTMMFTVNCWMFVRRRVSEALLNQDEVTLNTTVPMSLSCCCYGEDSVTSDFSSLTSSSVAASWLGLSDEFRVWWSVIPPVIIHVNIFIHPAHI